MPSYRVIDPNAPTPGYNRDVALGYRRIDPNAPLTPTPRRRAALPPTPQPQLAYTNTPPVTPQQRAVVDEYFPQDPTRAYMPATPTPTPRLAPPEIQGPPLGVNTSLPVPPDPYAGIDYLSDYADVAGGPVTPGQLPAPSAADAALRSARGSDLPYWALPGPEGVTLRDAMYGAVQGAAAIPGQFQNWAARTMMQTLPAAQDAAYNAALDAAGRSVPAETGAMQMIPRLSPSEIMYDTVQGVAALPGAAANLAARTMTQALPSAASETYDAMARGYQNLYGDVLNRDYSYLDQYYY